MRQRKYPYMIVGGPGGLNIGLEGPHGRKIAKRLQWREINDAAVEANLDIMEQLMDQDVAGHGMPVEPVDVKA